jgi:HD-like signal output (HDOD) protein
MTSSALKEVLQEIKSLEPLPEVAMRVLQLSREEDVIPRELVAVIQTDAGITAKVLKLCNSAYFGFRREIASLHEAGNLLGVSTLVNLVLTSCAGKYFRDYGPRGQRASRDRWEESVSNALAAGMIAGLAGVDKPRAYTAGLLVNVGHLVMDRFLPEKIDHLRAAIGEGASRIEAEQQVIGMDHAEIGCRLAQRWDFPEVMVDTIRHHHDPKVSEMDPRLAACAHLGEMFTQALDLGEGLEPMAYPMRKSALRICGLDRTGFERIEEQLRTEVQKARDLIEV